MASLRFKELILKKLPPPQALRLQLILSGRMSKLWDLKNLVNVVNMMINGGTGMSSHFLY